MSQSLFNEYEAFSKSGNELYDEFRKLTNEFLEKYSQMYSTVELEYICIGEITGKLAELRLKKALKKRKDEKNADN
jgi:hypothetical protein